MRYITFKIHNHELIDPEITWFKLGVSKIYRFYGHPEIKTSINIKD